MNSLPPATERRYSSTLVAALRARGHATMSLSPDDRYDVMRRDPNLLCEDDPAEIVNSSVFAPAHTSFHRIEAYADDPGLDRMPAELRPADAADTPPIAVTNEALAARYRRYRETNLDLCARVFDRVIAVSERTRTVLIGRGMPADRISLAYIGTAHAATFARATRVTALHGHLHIASLGYMRHDKGFYFLLDALEQMPELLARDLSVTIAAPISDCWAVERLRAMGHRFGSITVHDGFSHKTLPAILKGVTLGVVPPLWEDNLPQVAIEFVAHGIPILTSHRGGAQEIARHPSFVFHAGSPQGFAHKLEEITSGRLPLAAFWQNPPTILSMEQHVDELLRLYQAPSPNPAARVATAMAGRY